MDARQVIEVWERIVLPEYAVNFPMSYMSYRRLQDEVRVLKAKIYSSNDFAWNDQWFQAFDEKLFKAIKKELPECSSPQTKVLFYLLRN